MQLRFPTELTLEEYVSQEAWRDASLDQCPWHPEGECGCAGHGTYRRKVPMLMHIARWYCPMARATVSLLPDFLASRMPGTLDAMEEVVVAVEPSESREQAAQQVRPAEAEDAVTLPSALRWLRRRMTRVGQLLLAAAGILPNLVADATPKVSSFRQQLRTERVLFTLRERLEPWLHKLALPLGLVPPGADTPIRRPAFQQSRGPDPPRWGR